MYQNEKGQWVTDLAYYSTFVKEIGDKTSEDTQFQNEDFVGAGLYLIHLKFIKVLFSLTFMEVPLIELMSSAGDALEMIAKDQEEFEKEHQFMQVDRKFDIHIHFFIQFFLIR